MDGKRLTLVAAVGIALAALVVCVSLAAVTRSRSPGVALSAAPWDARAQARQADVLIAAAEGAMPRTRGAVELARSALRRDATIPGAWRVLGLAAASENDTRRASRLIHIAERISRRDLPTQTWLIEERVAAGDIDGALRHYDLALRGSSAATNVLMPILVGASSDPAILRPLRILLQRPSPWRHEFLRRLADAPSAEHAAVLIEAAAANDERPLPAVYLDLGNHYINLKKFGPGLRVLHAVAGGRRLMPLLRDGSFDWEPRIPPYDWRLSDAPNPSANLVRSGSRGHRLEMTATAGNGGMGAEQLVALETGRYRLQARRGTSEGVQAARIRARITCAESGVVLADVRLERPRNSVEFGIAESGCDTQWLRILLDADFSSSDIGGWVDDVALNRLQ